jgi:hypothetical protein
MRIKFRHFQEATERYGATIAWQIVGVVTPTAEDRFSPFFICNVGTAFQNLRDQFSKKLGREISLQRLQNNQLEIRLYADETVDHALFREIRRMTTVQAVAYKIPQKVVCDLKKIQDNASPFQIECSRKNIKPQIEAPVHRTNRISKCCRIAFAKEYSKRIKEGLDESKAIAFAIKSAKEAKEENK